MSEVTTASKVQSDTEIPVAPLSGEGNGAARPASAAPRVPAEQSKRDGHHNNGSTNQAPFALMQPQAEKKSALMRVFESIIHVLGQFGKLSFNVFSTMMYLLGLFGFLCGAAIPIITLWFFLHVDVTIRWWHIVLGIGGNIGIFIMSMNMIRDLYVQPLIDKIEAAQARAEWGEPPRRY